MTAAVALIFFYAPVDEDGLNQKIFYFHVPIALTAYGCFAWGGWKALRVLWKRDERADLESYVAIHQGVIFGALTLVTGSIWARFRWGLVPVSILAIRLSERFIHPVAFDRGGPNMAASQFLTFCVDWAALASLAVALYHVELAGKRLDARLRELRELLA